MAGDSRLTPRQIPFSGGVISDAPAVESEPYDLQNLLPPAGGGRGLVPRDGIEHLVELTTSDTSGHVIHKVTLDDAARTELIVVSSAATGRVELITDHTDMEGLQSVPPRGGGELPSPPGSPVHPLAMQIDGTWPDYTAKVLLYDASTDSVAGAASLAQDSYTPSGYFFRTENYLCAVDARLPNYQVHVSAWELSKLAANPTGTHEPDVSMVAYTDTLEVSTPFKPLWVYKGDILFFADDLGAGAHSSTGPEDDSNGAHDYRLYKVDLAAGTSTHVSITGLPSTVYGFDNREYDCDSVDVNGYLWVVMYGSGDDQILVKIDPSTGAVAASGAASPGVQVNRGLIALPDGRMAYMTIADIEGGMYVSSADAQTQSTLPGFEGAYPFADLCTFRNSIMGEKSIFWVSHDETASVALYDIPTGSRVGDYIPQQEYEHLPASVSPDGSQLWYISWDSSNKTSWVLTKANSDGTYTVTDSFTCDIGTDLPYVMADAYGYYLLNVQGDRLT